MENKEELLTFMKILKLDIEFTNQKIDMEKQMKRIATITFIMGLLTLLVVSSITTFNNKSVSMLDVVTISIVTTTIVRQMEDIFSCSKNIDFFTLELQHKEEKLEELNQVLKEM